MHDRIDPRVPVKLDKERHFLFNLAGMSEFQKLTGRNVLKDGINVLEMPPDELQKLFLVCLKHEDPELTEEDAGKLFDTKNIFEAITCLIEAITLALPEVPEEKEAKDKDPLAATGAPVKNKPRKA